MPNCAYSSFRSALKKLGRDFSIVDAHPQRRGDPLAGEALDVLDGVFGGVVEELADQAQALVVGDVRGGFLAQGRAVEVVREVGFDDRGRDGGADGERVEDHCCGPGSRIDWVE